MFIGYVRSSARTDICYSIKKMAGIQHENNNRCNVEVKTENPPDEQPREVELPYYAEMQFHHPEVPPYQRPVRDHPGVWRRPPSRRMRVMQRTDALVELLYSMANNPGRWVERLNEEIGDYDGYRMDDGANRRSGAYRGRGGNRGRGGPYRGRGNFQRGRGGEYQRRGGY